VLKYAIWDSGDSIYTEENERSKRAKFAKSVLALRLEHCGMLYSSVEKQISTWNDGTILTRNISKPKGNVYTVDAFEYVTHVDMRDAERHMIKNGANLVIDSIKCSYLEV